MLGWRRRKSGNEVSEADALRLAAPAASALFTLARTAREPRPVAPVVWIPGSEPPKLWLDEIGADPVALCPPLTVGLGRMMAWDRGQAEQDRGDQDRVGEVPADAFTQVPATANLPRISLARLPRGTAILGGGAFVTICRDRFLAEQFPPTIGPDPDDVDRVAPFDGLKVADIEVPTLLIARYGIGQWRQWICELLPKALLAERAFPGRFRFAMPQAVLDNADPCAAWSWMRDSLAAGGIAAERLLPLKPDTVYRFHALHAVSPVWAEGVLHPHAAQAVRDAFAAIPPAEARRIAVEPGPDAACVLDLAEPIYTLFAAHGFSRLRPSALPLAEQVAAFKGAVCVFGLDGEDLGNLILAPEGVHLITAGAELAGDPYERALVLDRAGRITRVRGTVAPGAEPAGPARLWLDSQAMAEVVA